MRIIILFPNSWLAYSPTIINLCECLVESGYEPEVYWVDDSEYNGSALPNWSKPLIIDKTLLKILRKLRLFTIFRCTYLVLKALLNKSKDSTFIGVDSRGYVCARLVNKSAIFLSLEAVNDKWLKLASFLSVDRLIIQSKERAHYLFPKKTPEKIAILPNSPIYISSKKRNIIKIKPGESQRPVKLIYFGNVVRDHGVEECIKGALMLGVEYELTIHGPVIKEYLNYLKNKYGKHNIKFSSNYIKQEEISFYLEKFDIGFAAYDLRLIEEGNFNYISCPSGKVYNYFLSGLPVIGVDILGLKIIEDSNAGILLKSLSPKDIANAINTILANYEQFSSSAVEAAEYFDFRKHFNLHILPLL